MKRAGDNGIVCKVTATRLVERIEQLIQKNNKGDNNVKKRALVTVLMILIACLALSGCSSGPSSPAPAASSNDKVLKLRLPSSLASLNPQHTTAPQGYESLDANL